MLHYLYSYLQIIKDLLSLGRFLIYLRPSLKTSNLEGKSITEIRLEGINIGLLTTKEGDLEIRIPRGLIINSKIIFLDTDGKSRLTDIDEALANPNSGSYIPHPEEALI
jgi:hypothetical protein